MVLRSFIMKPILLKIIIVLPLLLFADWVIMVLFGCFASMCGADHAFYCSVFCKAGIVLLSLTVLFVVFLPFLRKRKVEN